MISDANTGKYQPESSAAPPPSHLKKRGRAYWLKTLAEFDMDGESLELLRLACEALDRCEGARIRIRKDGAFVQDRFGKTKSHPGCEIERQSAALFARLRRELNLDVAPTDSRPPLLGSYR